VESAIKLSVEGWVDLNIFFPFCARCKVSSELFTAEVALAQTRDAILIAIPALSGGRRGLAGVAICEQLNRPGWARTGGQYRDHIDSLAGGFIDEATFWPPLLPRHVAARSRAVGFV
jgi:hypothetical protein